MKMSDLVERLREMPCGDPNCTDGAVPHGPTPDGDWEAEQCQICAYIKEAADRIEELENRLCNPDMAEIRACYSRIEQLESALDEIMKAASGFPHIFRLAKDACVESLA